MSDAGLLLAVNVQVGATDRRVWKSQRQQWRKKDEQKKCKSAFQFSSKSDVLSAAQIPVNRYQWSRRILETEAQRRRCPRFVYLFARECVQASASECKRVWPISLRLVCVYVGIKPLVAPSCYLRNNLHSVMFVFSADRAQATDAQEKQVYVRPLHLFFPRVFLRHQTRSTDSRRRRQGIRAVRSPVETNAVGGWCHSCYLFSASASANVVIFLSDWRVHYISSSSYIFAWITRRIICQHGVICWPSSILIQAACANAAPEKTLLYIFHVALGAFNVQVSRARV